MVSDESGIVIKVDGKVIGKPTYFGLDELEDIPKELLKRVYGEIEVPGLLEDVTADWGYVIENSVAYTETAEYVRGAVLDALRAQFEKEFRSLETRIRQRNSNRLQRLSEFKRDYATVAIERVIRRFYGDSEERIESVVAVVLDALEKDEYWEIIQAIHSADTSDVQRFADVLTEFGLVELALIGRQARYRVELLDSFDKLIGNTDTQEKQVHSVIERNMWIMGSDYAMKFSNRQLKTMLESYTQKKYQGDNPTTRPDLLMLSDLKGVFTLIEFKKPTISITRDVELQAQQYRDDLISTYHPMDIVLMGRDVDDRLRLHPGERTNYLSYHAVSARARSEVEWIIKSLQSE